MSQLPLLKQLSTSLSSISLLLALCCPSASGQTNYVNGTLITFSSNGAWCWYQDERAVVDVTNHKLLIASTRTSNGHNYVDMFNLTTLATTNYDLGSIGSDDHNAPGLIVRPDGQYLAMYAQHYDQWKSRYKIFNGTSWSATEQYFDWTTIPGGTDYTIAYSNLYYLSAENRMYDFARANDHAANFLVSTNQGTTWTFGGEVKTNTSNTYNKGYFKYWGNGVDRIDFISTEQHPRDTMTSMYHGYIKGGKSYKTDGTVADNDIFDRTYIPTDVNFTKIFGDSTMLGGYLMRRIWNCDLMRYDDGTIAAILTARTDTYTGTDASISPGHAFIYCRYDGTSWVPTYLGKAGAKLYSSEADYTGLAALCPNDPNTIFISSTFSPIDNSATTKHEIYRGYTANHGATWTWTAMTRSSTMDNIRPIVPAWDNAHIALLWLRGTYTSAQNVNTAVVGLLLDPALPVELTAFNAATTNATVALTWTTATERNNFGFDVERRAVSGGTSTPAYEKIGFVNGRGTSNAPHRYSFVDMTTNTGKYSYRLKQIDNDGQYAYSGEVEVDRGVAKHFQLGQNYPNPFNPTTTITFTVDEPNVTTLKVYNLLGQESATLFNGYASAGTLYSAVFDASPLASGMYFSVLKSGTRIETKKLIVSK